MNSLNAGLLLAGVLGAFFLAFVFQLPPVAVVTDVPPGRATRRIEDANGNAFPQGHYRRILSASTVMDRVLLDLCGQERLVAVTAYSKTHDPHADDYGDIPALLRLDDLEQVLALTPDLIVMNGYGDVGRIERLREQGLVVFDLGREQGFDALLEDIQTVSELVGLEAAGARYASHLRRRMEQVAPGITVGARRTALYLSPSGDRIYGGTRGSTQHDILHYAGLTDVAAETHRGFPDYRVETLLGFRPQVVVTKTGMAAQLCSRPGLSAWPACQGQARIVELDEALLDLGGPAMVEAAEALHGALVP